MLPKATIYSAKAKALAVWARIKAWARQTAKVCALLFVTAFGYGMTQIGCRNDAITFAKTIYTGDVKCSAIYTCPALCNGESDIAVCRVPSNGQPMVVRCTVDHGSYKPEAVCIKVFDQ